MYPDGHQTKRLKWLSGTAGPSVADDAAGNDPQEAEAVRLTLAQNYAAAAGLLALEHEARSAATANLRTLIQRLFQQIAGRYVVLAGSIEQPLDAVQAQQLVGQIVAELDALRRIDFSTPLAHYADLAVRRGLEYGNRYVSQPVPAVGLSLPSSVSQAVGGVAQAVAERVDAAQQMAQSLGVSEFKDLTAVQAKAQQISTPVDRAVSYAISTANSHGLAVVAGQRGGQLLWVAERDACVVCLALSGHLIDPMTGEGFDEDATFGKPGSAPPIWPPEMPLAGPPRHNFCRCHAELWFGMRSVEGGPLDGALYNRPDLAAQVDLPAALRREAKRSVLRGWSLPSESQAARINAADRLLRRGAGMPKTVEDRARRQVRNKRFDSRSVPRGSARRP